MLHLAGILVSFDYPSLWIGARSLTPAELLAVAAWLQTSEGRETIAALEADQMIGTNAIDLPPGVGVLQPRQR